MAADILMANYILFFHPDHILPALLASAWSGKFGHL
jgi:hypothetical protein